ncbi:hypothetical protein CGRA01v4_06474 [Colletotrichum graminicola]|uniref:Uncharacterized protein n=1 Tax=Colletotrichum graminicola (strain M1.001 / M2 / FGSC 10212) TaxID=645133 RepID=E3Q286_COLGM|nr:uncharacterized protein GLRG_00331 [Colletotrichum graminicola M1.001]EFQ25187.1 hypothetical protein GLRG_00331 [Colletotrichum graminicola M1.001]WDK15193.1 hypothetical protein CGRA01v4_06474 [Colletotrichum graminicola]
MSLNAIWKATEARCNEVHAIIIEFELLPRAYQVLDEDDHWLLAIALQKLVVERLYELRPKMEMVKLGLAVARDALLQGYVSEFDTEMSNMVARMKAHVVAWNGLKGEQLFRECY